jgi:hypothetical protein
MKSMNLTRIMAVLLLSLAMVAVVLSPSLSMGADSGSGGGDIGDPGLYNLYAGQRTLVGHIEVWNDADCIYVKYMITEPGWYLTETHVEVGDDMADIPQTKGNPIPGKFSQGESYSVGDLITEDIFCFPRGDCDDFSKFIAAHASVVHMCGCQVDRCETAWAATEVGQMPFPGKNWATFITYEIQGGWDLVETLTVMSNDIDGETSMYKLDSDRCYKIVVSGYFINTGQGDEWVDAAYLSMPPHDDPWMANHPGYDDKLLELQINEQFVNWGAYDATHEYSYVMPGNDAQVTFRVFDGNVATNAQDSGWMGDNSGSLTVMIYQSY